MICRKAITVLIMPTDYCNMNCVYCFNARKTNLEKIVMSEEMLYKVMESTLPHFDRVRFIWHGGEPLAAGIEFYKKAVDFQKKYSDLVDIHNSLQSNMTLLTEEYIDFFIENDFKVGASYDLSANNKTRHESQKILENVRKANARGLKVSLISVVSNYNINSLIEDYEWCKKENLSYTLNLYQTDMEGRLSDKLSIDEDVYVEKICEFFDYWIQDINCTISIRYFNVLIDFIINGKRSICCYNSCLGRHLAVVNDGRIFVCNRDFPDEYCLGTINDYYPDIRDAFESKGFFNLLKATVERRNNCKSCELFHFCGGGCISNAILDGGISKKNGYNCRVLLPIFTHIEEQLAQISELPLEQLKNRFNPTVVDAIVKKRR